MPEKKEVKSYFEDIAYDYDELKQKNKYYYDFMKKMVIDIANRFSYNSVLDVGCGTGEILNALNPDKGIGIDISSNMIELSKKKFKKFDFIASDFDRLELKRKFDLILIIDLIEHLGDINRTIIKLNELSDKKTTIVISSPSYYWKAILYIGEKLKMKMPEGSHRWIPPKTLKRVIKDKGFSITSSGYRLIIPKKIPFISDIINSIFYRIPLVRNLGLVHYLVCEPNKSKGDENN